MKKILTSILIVLIFSTGIVRSQTTRPFELGFNAGASWQQSDIKMKKLGGAGGFTFGRMHLENDKSVLDWGWRFRYLKAITYGQDNQKSTGISQNEVLNGSIDTALDYNSHGGFVYQNYKTTINECSLELLIGANKFRNRTNFYPYIFGGLGITKAVAKTNQLNANGLRYDYLKLDSVGTPSSADINNLYDGSYETAAEGSTSPTWKFMPSLGVGLGYQVTKGFSLGLEYKATWALNDVLDGQQWSNTNTKTGTNDKYYYASAWLKFTFGRTERAVTTDNTIHTTDPNGFTNTGDKPSIMLTNPSISPVTSPSQSYTVKAIIKNVGSKSDIGLVYNGASNTNFTYDAGSSVFTFPVMLLSGNNNFMITATNANGSSTENATVLFDSPVVVPATDPAPVVTITSPSLNPYSTTMNNATVVANILNVTSQSQISVMINGVSTSSYIFNSSSHTLNLNTNLNSGANTVTISASNPSGNDSKTITIIYNYSTPVVTTPPPVVTFVNPAVNPFNTAVASLPINALVQNVTAVGQISVTNNGTYVSSSLLGFNPSTGQLSFTANLISGSNSITISATNVSGADSKTEMIIYTPQVVSPTAQAPVVTITSPTVNPYTAPSNSAVVNAIVLNVASASQISVSLNGVATSAFSYNMGTKQLSYTAGLISGANVVTISAANSAGADSKSETIIYSQPVVTSPAPVITITSPLSNPFNSTSNMANVIATILHVNSMSDISVSLNGVSSPSFTFNTTTKQFSFPASLIVGANIITITANNLVGSDTKSETIIYTQPAVVPAPVVTITSPSSNPFTSTINTSSVDASVSNITSASQVAVTINGTPTVAFTYSASTHTLAVPVSLITGTNSIIITATNASGVATGSETIIYSAPAVVLPPVVTITSPASNPFNSSTASTSVNATVTNIASASHVAVSINGSSTSGFTYSASTHAVSIPVSLIVGANTVVITATNLGGLDTKSETIIYSALATALAPIVTITSPVANPFNTSINTSVVNATVLNITSASQIAIAINGATTSAFTFNAMTHVLVVPVSLLAGSNSVTITATNSTGADTKSETIIYTAPAVVLPPVVTIISPSSNPFNSSVATATVDASVTNVTSAGQIAVAINGSPTSAFSFNASSHSVVIPLSLVAGANTVTITGTNSAGADARSETIIYTAPVVVLPPVVTITSPSMASSSSASSTYNVEGVITNIASASNITVKVNGVTVSAVIYIPITKKVKFTANLNEGANTITVSATNSAGSDSKTVTILYEKPTAPIPADTAANPSHTPGAFHGGGLNAAANQPTIVFVLTNPYSTADAVITTTAVVNGVANQASIVVKLNSAVVPFTYNVHTKTITVTGNLNIDRKSVV